MIPKVLSRFVVCGSMFALMSCADQDASRSVRPPGALPETVDVPAAEVQVGTANGTIRRYVSVDSFSITRFPITVAQYRECVSAGGCSAPRRDSGSCATSDRGTAGATYTPEVGEREGLPLTCAAPSQARGFCRWVGGRLPTLQEWLYAARGKGVQKYSWGNSAPTCERHGSAVAFLGKEACCKGDCSVEDLLSVGRHPDGKSPVGLEDVLLAPAELVGYAKDAPLGGCRSDKAGCVVSTVELASIDAVLATTEKEDERSPIWSFRCLWEG